MTDFTPILACRGPEISDSTVLLILAVVGGWLLSIVLALVNPFLICFLDVSKGSKFAHLLAWAIYVGLGLALAMAGASGTQNQAWLFPLIGVPVFAICHFIGLLWARRWIRQRKQAASES